jgi:ribonucleoside-diphosphate reductase alpha chain
MTQRDELPTLYQQYIHKSRYSRYLTDGHRRETWNETVERYFNFFTDHLQTQHNFSLSDQEKETLKHAVLALEVMPSMRCLMTAGEALRRENISGYNCSYVAVNTPRAFDEILYVLMNGTGVGFSVERQEVNELPRIADDFHTTDTTIIVSDSKLGWAKALKELIHLLYGGQIPKWDLSKVRPAGTPLKTFGGRASGPEPLDELFHFTTVIFKQAAGRKLTSLECHDICCKIAEIVVVGGVRRSALISLSNLSDDRMRFAKSGQWWETQTQRALANNSACYTEKPDMGIFMDEWKALYDSKSGERGIFNREAAQVQAGKNGRRDTDWSFGTNPCSEIILRSEEFCNLSEVVVRSEDTEESLIRKVELATILGTMQSTLVNFKYLNKRWTKNCQEERLLGVSLTGIMDCTLTNGKKKKLPELLNKLSKVAVETNKVWAENFGINQSVAVTCVKPSGCTGLDTVVKTSTGDQSMAHIFSQLVPEKINIFRMEAGTWIEPTEELLVYDKNNDLQEVTKLYVNGIAEVYIVKFDDGTMNKFTKEHKLMTSDGWVRVDKLSEGDGIVKFTKTGKKSKKNIKIKSVRQMTRPEVTVDIEVANTHSYQLGNGAVSHNTVSQLVDSASGIHARHSQYYIRTVRGDKKDPLTKMMRDAGFPCEDDVTKPEHTTVFSFPVKGPQHGVYRTDMTAIEQLELWLVYQNEWCEHKPSVTISVKEDEWMEVGAWVYKHFDDMSGVSFLPFSEHQYRQAPYQDCTKEEYEALEKSMPKDIDWSLLAEYEKSDMTIGSQELSCTSGGCDIV